MNKTLRYIKVAFLSGSLFFACTKKKQAYTKLTDNETSVFIKDVQHLYFKSLDSCAHYLSKIDTTKTFDYNKKAFLNSRKWYKKAEPFIVAFDYENYKTLNGPNLLKVEEEAPNDIKKIKPKSFQVIEELLFADEIDNKSLHNTLIFMNARLPFIKINHLIYRQSDRHFLKMIRDQIVLVATKGITGFDSPMLANSLLESSYNYQSILKVLSIYKDAFSNEAIYHHWVKELNATIDDLTNGNFETFDRYAFIKNHTNTQLSLVNETAKDWDIALKELYYLNPKADNLFASDFLNLPAFGNKGAYNNNQNVIQLGKKIFNDKSLSKDNVMSCATCHDSKKAFTDGFTFAKSNKGKPLLRNTPTLAYVAYQQSFFYDAIAFSLEGQIKNVVENTQEFHTDLFSIEKAILSDSTYVSAFEKLYDDGVTNRNILNAITNYERSLGDFTSKFDQNMQGKVANLSASEKNGFNLFMGKATCATCHFPPTFNGTVPPKYDESELENLGVPKNADFDNPIKDTDLGRYYLYNIEERKYFFKTPTIRNITLTAPYMHNGVYSTLEEVVTFYNKGGGLGLGIDNPNQTLPEDQLELTDKETKDLVNFMKTLTDETYLKD